MKFCGMHRIVLNPSDSNPSYATATAKTDCAQTTPIAA
jgi:hypothetical protein